jgi:hypothetical protein
MIDSAFGRFPAGGDEALIHDAAAIGRAGGVPPRPAWTRARADVRAIPNWGGSDQAGK